MFYLYSAFSGRLSIQNKIKMEYMKYYKYSHQKYEMFSNN